MRTMNAASLVNYDQIKSHLPKVKDQIKAIIESNPGINSHEISLKLNKPTHTFSGRLTDLKNDNLIESIGLVKVGKTSFNQWKLKSIN
jgi:predicted transcriptional regulator